MAQLLNLTEVRRLKAKVVKKENEGVKIIPLGGLEKHWNEYYSLRVWWQFIVVDCGLSFPADDMLGIDLVIPDVTYLENNIDKVKGFVITHGHEDHIGALPYVLKGQCADLCHEADYGDYRA